MGFDVSFAGFMRDHDMIDAMTMRLDRCCMAAVPAIDEVCDAWHALREVLADHLRREDANIYSVLMRNSSKSGEATAAFVSNFVRLLADWQDYLDDWDPAMVAADWAEFSRKTLAMMVRVRERTRAETELIYPLALQIGVLVLRDRGAAVSNA